MIHRSLAAALLVLAVFVPTPAQELTMESLDQWLDYVRPHAAELTWMKVPWRAALGEAVAEGRRRDLPILLWAMNGHPLACV